MTKFFQLSFTAALACAAAGCGALLPDLRGDGELVEAQFPVSEFTAVEVTDVGDVEITPGATSVTMTMDRNILESGLLHVTVDRGVLVIGGCETCRGVTPSDGAAIRIAAPAIRSVSAYDSVTVHADLAVERPALSASDSAQVFATLSGALAVSATARDDGEIEITGTAPELTVYASDGGEVQSTAQSESVVVDANDGATVSVIASVSARGEASDGSSVTVAGSPAERSIETSDGSTVRYP